MLERRREGEAKALAAAESSRSDFAQGTEMNLNQFIRNNF